MSFIIFGQWAKLFWLSGTFFSAALSKLHATCLQKRFEREKKENKNVFSISGNWTEFFRPFVNFFSAGLSKLPSTRPQEQFEGVFSFDQNICIITYSHKERKVLSFIWNFFSGIVKSAIMVSRRTIWEKHFMRKYETLFIVFGHCAKTVALWQIMLHFGKSVRWTLLTKKTFYQKNFTIFSHGAKTCLLFVEIVPTGLTKLHCRWPKEYFQNSFFLKKSLNCS